MAPGSAGSASAARSSARARSSQSGRASGRSYTGASSVRARTGTSATTSPRMRARSTPSAVTRPIGTASSSHFWKTRWTSASRPALDDEQHPFLGLRQEDLVGRHPRLALGHSVEVHVGAGPRPRGHLGEGAGQAGRAHVLDPHHRAGPERLEARLEEELLGERVAHLDGGAPLGRGLVEGLRRHGRPVDAVAARLGADVEEGVPHPVGPRPVDAVRPHQAQAQDVHQRVPRVLRREGHLAADRRAPEAVAVVGDPGDDPAEKEPRPRLVDRSEAERVEERDRTGAHREDVAEDAAHPGRRALERLDERRVVVALDLEGEAEPAPDVHDAGVLARALEHVRALRREAPEVDAARTCTSSARTRGRRRGRAPSRWGPGRSGGRRGRTPHASARARRPDPG